MAVDRHLRLGLLEDVAGLLRVRVVRVHAGQRSRILEVGDLVHQHVDAVTELQDVLGGHGVAADEHRLARVIDAIADRRLDGTDRIVLDGEHRDGDAVLVEDDAVLRELVRFDRRGRGIDFLVRDAHVDVVAVGALHSVADVPDADGPVELEGALAPTERRDVAAHPEVGQAVDVVGVEVGEEDGVDLTDRNAGLREAHCGSASRIEDEVQAVGLDQRGHAVALGARHRAARAEQRHAHLPLGGSFGGRVSGVRGRTIRRRRFLGCGCLLSCRFTGAAARECERENTRHHYCRRADPAEFE